MPTHYAEIKNRLKDGFVHTANHFTQTAFSANKTYPFSDGLIV